HRIFYEYLMDPINMSPQPAPKTVKKEWCTLLEFLEGKKALEEVEKDAKKLTAGQEKLVRNIGSLYVTSLLLESIQHVVANRMNLAKEYAERAEKAVVSSFPQELINKINPLLLKLKTPPPNFQQQVYKAITQKDPPQDLQARIHQAIVPT